MANQEYTIEAVSPKVDEWDGQYGSMKTYYVKLNGNTVKLNKKPDSPAPTKGETLYGYIQPNQYGDQFKPQKKPFTPAGFKADPDKQNQIKAQWSIGQAVSATQIKSSEKGYLEDVEYLAKQFFSMVDRVKNGTTTGSTIETKTTKATTAGNYRRDDTEADEKVVLDFDENEPINLDEIPF